jgi:26S proteasome regulatory subunit N5
VFCAPQVSCAISQCFSSLFFSQAGQLRTATEEMLALEKKTRQSGDSDSSVKVSEAIVQAAFDVKDFDALNSVLALLSKRRGQFKRVILRIVNMAIEYVERLPKPEQLKLIDTLRAITEGKIFVENERARLTRQLARMKEAEGDLKTASKLMQVFF